MHDQWAERQLALCAKHSVAPVLVHPGEKVGIARNVRTGLLPINGLRCAPENGTTGWFIWAGEQMSEDPDFFVPLHVEHLEDWCPAAMPYLLLPEGWRFLVAGEYEDVWFDPQPIA